MSNLDGQDVGLFKSPAPAAIDNESEFSMQSSFQSEDKVFPFSAESSLYGQAAIDSSYATGYITNPTETYTDLESVQLTDVQRKQRSSNISWPKPLYTSLGFDVARSMKGPCCNRNTYTASVQCNRLNKECIKSIAARIYRRQRQVIIPFIWGILVGVTITAVMFQQRVLYSTSTWTADVSNRIVAKQEANFARFSPDITRKNSNIDKPELSNQELLQELFPNYVRQTSLEHETRLKTRIYVGVITAEKFLGTRSLAVNSTWGNQVDKVEFFTQHGSREKYGIPVVNLDKASDTEYPPQKKAFEMLKSMCSNHINDFEWFIRADDDVYIRVQMLKKFLSRIDGDRMIYMGQPGHGVPEVRDKLGLKGHNFCMGGPGVIFNRRALKALCPHLDSCMEEIVSREEDVEIGRCVTNHLHIECTHAWETLKLFYHSYQEEYKEEKPFLGNLAENEHVSKALTLHHLKLPYIMYRVHRHYTSLMLNSTVQEMTHLHKNIDETNRQLPVGEQRHLSSGKRLVASFKPRRLDDVCTWKSFAIDSVYDLSLSHVARDITNDVLADLKQIGETGIDEAVGMSLPSKFTYSHLSDGYIRSDPLRGTDYLLDVYFTSKESTNTNQVRRVHLVRPAGDLEVSAIRQSSSGWQDVDFYIILPVKRSRPSEFESFMRTFFEPTFLLRTDVPSSNLIVIPFGEEKTPALSSQTPSSNDIVHWYRATYPGSKFVILENAASNAKDALQQAYAKGIMYAYEELKEDKIKLKRSVVILTDVNISLTHDVLKSCVFRTGVPSQGYAYSSYYSNYNFVDYKRRRRKAGQPPPSQLYQPVPFRVYPSVGLEPWPTSLVPQNPDSKSGRAAFPHEMVKSEFGFWDSGLIGDDEGNAVTAPLCGRLSDIYPSASESVSLANSSRSVRTFRDLLYEKIYAGHLTLMRVPDRAFVNIPRS
ncbi:unnamed protein product [Clavelina lepadiformis]|uniref:Hexosyltransferase n=1 Tax=Clavelina lepadiformis TaxID=159417 RepID=A0ABP0GIK1_CLALP